MTSRMLFFIDGFEKSFAKAKVKL